MCDSKGDCNESSKTYYKRRKRLTIRCGCRAHIQLKSVDGGFFEVDYFVEGHNHRMVVDSDMQFVHSARKLTHVQEEAIYELSNMNLGPVKAFNLMRTQYDGFEKVGATKDDCKNFRQGLNCYIGEYDAEMIVQRLCAKKTFSSDYSFEYDVNDNRELIRMFWADETSKSNYLAFGDIISFDATFKTNKYKMVFVPFTAIDNHCHSVTVCAGLLASETIESYTWLLQMLLKSFGQAPKVVTDQDPAMKQAIAAMFPNTRHRLCMWHIMKKVADKVGADLCNNEDFKSRLCNIVWTDSISPLEFEKKWQAIMVEFELDKNKWLTDMYEIRFDWIPAFYRDELLSGLILRNQKLSQKEAVRIYTRAISNDLQDEMNEIVGSVSQFSSCEEGGFLRCKIMDFNAYVPGFLEDGEFGE
ncbi:protein FAR1-RELATED SEQUENCE 5-like [Bidens hawaiensis]|uniref:protein FAR1-RELATED SEQUENCE 5-like n=1 Tax=Bidens hawaiensis TaxID=980011 RepID=UPI00404AC94E